MFRALSHRNFRLFWAGAFLSNVGTWMQALAQGILVYQLTHSAFWLGFDGFMATSPGLVFTLLAGVFADAGYESGRTTLAAGDRLLLFTDGLVEAMDATGAEFGDGALVDRLRREADSNAARLIASIFDDVRRWSGGPLSDDATALALVAERTWTASSHNRTSVADPRVQRGAIRAKTSPTAGADVA